jgi:hypothetical protein
LASKPLSKEVCLAAIALMAKHSGNKSAAARDAGVAKSTFQNRLDAANRVVPGASVTSVKTEKKEEKKESPLKAAYVPTAEITRLQDQVQALRSELKSTHRDNLEAAHVRSTIFGLSEHTAEPPEWLGKIKQGAKSRTAGVPVTIWSDWHMGETVFAGQVNGVNAFNMEIAEQRVRTLVSSTIDLCKEHMTNPDYPGIVINILGDMVTGEIHEELAQTNDEDLIPTVLRTVDILAWALTQMADAFGKVFCPCTPGNHGRTTKRCQAKNFAVKNWDWMIYVMLEKHFRAIGDDRIQFQIPETGEALYKVYGHRYMAVHGHDLGVKGGDGIIGAIGPITRGSMKVSHSSAQIGRDFDTLLMGHWHQTLWLPRIIVNNSLKGYDEFARSFLRASYSPAAQSLWFQHPDRGITARWEVALEDKVRKNDSNWVTWETAE